MAYCSAPPTGAMADAAGVRRRPLSGNRMLGKDFSTLCGFGNEHMEARTVFLAGATPQKATALGAFKQAAASFHNLPSQLSMFLVTRIRVWHHW